MPIPHSFYAPYRQPLDAEERQKIAEAEAEQRAFEAAHRDLAADHVEVAMGDGGLHGAASPLATAHIFVANIRATAQQAAMDCTVPDDPTICDRYPGVDPLGKYCEVDMAFGQREQAVRAALLSRPAEVREFVTGMLDRAARTRALLDANGNRIPDPVRLMRQNMSGDCMNIWMNERAAKLCFDETASGILLEEAASRARGSASIRRYEGFMTTMEQLAGLKGGPISQEFRDTFRNNMQAEIPPAVEALRSAPDVIPTAIDINFPDFTNQIAQRFFSNPRNWGKTAQDLPQDVVNVDKAIEGIDRYATATVDNTVSAVFRSTEKNFGGAGPDDLNRANLLTVDGKLVGDMLRERHTAAFNSGKTAQPYADWFRENARRETARIVGAGLMAGKRVEAFIPDKNGVLPAEPVQVTKSGFEPKPMQPVILSAWERFASFFGFYREKVAARQEYERAMAGRERARQAYEQGIANHDLRAARQNAAARDLLQDGSTSLKAMFFAPDEITSSGNDTFRLSRRAPASACVCGLLNQGHAIEDILDPNKLQNERRAMGQRYLQAYREHDAAWLGAQYYEGMKKLLTYLDNYDRRHDLLAPRTVAQHYVPLQVAAATAFDVTQECTCGDARFSTLKAAEAEALSLGRRPTDLVSELTDRLNTVTGYMDSIAKSTEGAVTLMDGTDAFSMHSNIAAIFVNAQARRLLSEARAAHPDMPLSRLMPAEAFMNTNASCTVSPVTRAIVEEAQSDPAFARALGEQALTGQLQDTIKSDYVCTTEKQNTGVTREILDDNGVLIGAERALKEVDVPWPQVELHEVSLTLGGRPVAIRSDEYQAQLDAQMQAPKKDTGGRTRR